MSAEKRIVIQSLIEKFRDQKQTAERAVDQVSDEQFHQPLDENSNSLAVIMKHMAGNLRSRFTDFLTSDGEKPDRDRDSEFVEKASDRSAVLSAWERGWKCLFDSLDALTDDDLGRNVMIRNQPHTVAEALLRAVTHAAYHVGQLVQLSRFLAKDRWKTLSIPRGASREFYEKMQVISDK